MADRLPQRVQFGFNHARRGHGAPLQGRGRFGHKGVHAQCQGPQCATGASVLFHQVPDFADQGEQLPEVLVGFRGQTNHRIEFQITHALRQEHLRPRQDDVFGHLFANELPQPF